LCGVASLGEAQWLGGLLGNGLGSPASVGGWSAFGWAAASGVCGAAGLIAFYDSRSALRPLRVDVFADAQDVHEEPFTVTTQDRAFRAGAGSAVVMLAAPWPWRVPGLQAGCCPGHGERRGPAAGMVLPGTARSWSAGAGGLQEAAQAEPAR
jgi:hypothetical protein